MIGKDQLKKQLKEMGIQPDDTVVIHTSMKAIGPVEGGAETVIQAFIEYLSDGLFIVPTHTWANVNKEHPIYDRSKTPPCIGLIPNMILKVPGVLRSLHPTHSIAAVGRNAALYIKGEEQSTTPAPQNGCWARLYNQKAKVLLIGVGQERHTYLHAVEEELGIPRRLSPEPISLEIRDHGSFISKVNFHPHKHPTLTGMSARYVKFEKPFFHLNAMKYAKFGEAPVQVCDSQICHDVMSMLWKKADYDLTEDYSPVPEEWYL